MKRSCKLHVKHGVFDVGVTNLDGADRGGRASVKNHAALAICFHVLHSRLGAVENALHVHSLIAVLLHSTCIFAAYYCLLTTTLSKSASSVCSTVPVCPTPALFTCDTKRMTFSSPATRFHRTHQNVDPAPISSSQCKALVNGLLRYNVARVAYTGSTHIRGWAS